MQDLVITDAGQEVIAQMIAGTSTVTFTKLQTSAHDYSEIPLRSLSQLEDVRQEALVSFVTRINDTTVEVIAAVNNSELEEGYYIKAVGLFAKDENDSEVLFGISIETDNPDYLPAYNGHTVSGVTYKINTKVDISSQVTLEINPAAVATEAEVDDLRVEVKSHVETKKVYSEDGAHGIRFDGTLQVENDSGEWISTNVIADDSDGTLFRVGIENGLPYIEEATTQNIDE